jgi:hypothetical protein
MPLIALTWCPLGSGAIYDGETLLDPGVLPLNTAKIPAVLTYFNIVPINQIWYGGAAVIPPGYTVQVTGNNGVGGRVYATIEAVPYEYNSTPTSSWAWYFYDSGTGVTSPIISIEAEFLRAGLPFTGDIDLDPTVNLGPLNALQLPGNYFYVVITTGTIYTVGLTYTGANLTPVDEGQAILILGTSLTNPAWSDRSYTVPGTTSPTISVPPPDGFPSIGADSTQFGTIYAEYFTLPTPPWT